MFMINTSSKQRKNTIGWFHSFISKTITLDDVLRNLSIFIHTSSKCI